MKDENILLHCYIGAKAPDYHRYYALFHTGNRGNAEANFALPQGFVPKYFGTLSATEIREVLAHSQTSNAGHASEIRNLIDVMSFLRYGSCKLDVFNGMLDFFHPLHRITVKPLSDENGFEPIYGYVPTSGQYSLQQKMTCWLLSHLPFHSGRVEVSYAKGLPNSIVMETSNYIRIVR